MLHLFLDAALKTVAYLRVSTRSQDLANQKLAILEFSQKRRFPIDQFIESRISSRLRVWPHAGVSTRRQPAGLPRGEDGEDAPVRATRPWTVTWSSRWMSHVVVPAS